MKYSRVPTASYAARQGPSSSFLRVGTPTYVRHVSSDCEIYRNGAPTRLGGEKPHDVRAEHKEAGMVDVKNKNRTCERCGKQPIFNKEGEAKARFCAEHKEAGDGGLQERDGRKVQNDPPLQQRG